MIELRRLRGKANKTSKKIQVRRLKGLVFFLPFFLFSFCILVLKICVFCALIAARFLVTFPFKKHFLAVLGGTPLKAFFFLPFFDFLIFDVFRFVFLFFLIFRFY